MSQSHPIIKLSKGGIRKLQQALHNPYGKLGLSWPQIIRIKHLAAGKERKTTVNGHAVNYWSPVELIHALKEIFIEQVYLQQFGPQPYILDCGANIGMSAIYFKQLAPDAIIEAFEPDELNFNLLSKNVASFGLQQVQLHKKAIWKENTHLQFEAEGQMSSKISDDIATEKRTVTIEAVRLKDLLNKRVDFLKMDIEGAEYQVLKDAAPNLHVVQTMFVEYHGTYAQNNELLEILQIMHNAGFQFYIKEAAAVFHSPLSKEKNSPLEWDVQLNIFCTRK